MKRLQNKLQIESKRRDIPLPVSQNEGVSAHLTEELKKSSSTISDREFEVLKLIHERYHLLYWQSGDSLTKMWTVHLAITATLVGYVLTKGLSPTLPKQIIIGCVVISFGAIVAFAGWAWGMRKVLHILARVTTTLDASIATDLQLDRLFKYWQSLLLFIIIGTVLSGLAFIGGMLLLMHTR